MLLQPVVVDPIEDVEVADVGDNVEAELSGTDVVGTVFVVGVVTVVDLQIPQ